VLRDVSFVLEPGETIAVVGHTGAGKTTLISLLMRFYDVQRGAIRIDGVDIKEMDLDDLRGRFGVVLQDPFLFSGTVASNIRLGRRAFRTRTWSRQRRTSISPTLYEPCPEDSKKKCASAVRRSRRAEAADFVCSSAGAQSEDTDSR